jgi:hypothetical protein
MLTLLNFASEETVVELPPSIAARETLVSTHAIVKPSQRIDLAPREGRLVRLA